MNRNQLKNDDLSHTSPSVFPLLHQARRLLVETDFSIEEIATATGYRDPAYFARQFKREQGMTPLTWRRASRG